MTDSNLAFEETTIPSTTSKEPNPFDGKFPADDKALSVVVDGDADSAAIKKLRSQARKAANSAERSARVKVEDASEGSGKNRKVRTRFTVWTVAQISRPRSDGNETEAAASADNPATATA